MGDDGMFYRHPRAQVGSDRPGIFDGDLSYRFSKAMSGERDDAP